MGVHSSFYLQDLGKKTKGDPKNRGFGNQRYASLPHSRSTVETGFLGSWCVSPDLETNDKTYRCVPTRVGATKDRSINEMAQGNKTLQVAGPTMPSGGSRNFS
ncbi:hypothetical protein MiSe_68290 [Microseira wollei NIES-4236]|uniref:Uncharacterized protein n=1 Tax=Microseira wollei NIES-4236 TaxID=2530354 RepID=A0AAV3XLU0_9CYAN|nr:hypothetical protein MiSe_68290 [Microseira wollei NIES-4236]